MKTISFDDFKRIMNNLEDIVKFEFGICDALTAIHAGLDYNTDFPSDTIIYTLNVIFGETAGDSLIDYWVYDLEFGKYDNPVTLNGGVEMRIRTISDLYDALMYNVVYRIKGAEGK